MYNNKTLFAMTWIDPIAVTEKKKLLICIEIRKSTGQPDFFRIGKIDTLFVAAMIQSVLVGK